jgi:Uma2 family endonuclease
MRYKKYMPTAVLPLAAEGAPRRKRFTRAEVDRMIESGFFTGQRYELIDGDLIDKMGQNPPHATTIRRVHGWLVTIFAAELVQMQLPIDVAADDRELNLPEPDLSVLAGTNPDYTSRHPRGDETVLVIEVADTSIRHDTAKKRDLYARASVPEYWVFNIADRELIVHRALRHRRYQQVTTFSEEAVISVEARPNESIQVARLLP